MRSAYRLNVSLRLFAFPRPLNNYRLLEPLNRIRTEPRGDGLRAVAPGVECAEGEIRPPPAERGARGGDQLGRAELPVLRRKCAHPWIRLGEPYLERRRVKCRGHDLPRETEEGVLSLELVLAHEHQGLSVLSEKRDRLLLGVSEYLLGVLDEVGDRAGRCRARAGCVSHEVSVGREFPCPARVRADTGEMGSAHEPIHPGEILREEYLRPMGISEDQAAETLQVSGQQIAEILEGSQPITLDLDLGLSELLGTSSGFWVGLQADYDRAIGRQSR